MALVALIGVLVLTSCALSGESEQTASTVGTTTSMVAGCANVIEAGGDSPGDTRRVPATIVSSDTGWEKYADAWEVRTPGRNGPWHPYSRSSPRRRATLHPVS